MEKLVDGIKYSIEDNILTLKIELTGYESTSSSGKSTVLATTRGNVEIADGIKVGINIYKPK